MENTKQKNPRKPMDEAKKKKIQKIVSIIINVLVVIILALALVITIFNLVSKNNNKGYTAFGSTAYLTVETESMQSNLQNGGTYNIGDSEYHAENVTVKVGSFRVGDLLKIHLLSDEEKLNLKVGDVITFTMPTNSTQTVLNSHRIVNVQLTEEGGKVVRAVYKTKGDNNDVCDSFVVDSSQTGSLHALVGVVEQNVGGIGRVFRFFRSSTGFLVCVVVPSFLIVAYFTFNLVRELLRRRAAGEGARKAQMKAELLAELRAQGLVTDSDHPADTETIPEPSDGAPTEGTVAEGEPTVGTPTDGEPAAEKTAEPIEEQAEVTEEKPTEEATPAESAIEPTVEEKPAETVAEPTPAKKTPAKKTPAKKQPAKKTPAKKPANKSTTKKTNE